MANNFFAYDSDIGAFKVVYDKEGIKNLTSPKNNWIMNTIPFSKQEIAGQSYNFPVLLTRASGYTPLNPYAQTSTGSGTSLKPAKAAIIRQATIAPYRKVNRAGITGGSLSASDVGSAGAYESLLNLAAASVFNDTSFYEELSHLYGGTSYASITGTTAIVAQTATTIKLRIDLQTYATGMFVGAENLEIQLYKRAGASAGNGTLIAAGDTLTITEADIDYASRTITITALAASITAIAAALAAGNDVLDVFFSGAMVSSPSTSNLVFNEGLGFASIMNPTLFNRYSTTPTNSVYGINFDQFGIWKGNTLDAGGAAPQLGQVLTATAKVASKYGSENSEYVALTSNATFKTLVANEAALVRHTKEPTMGTTENGYQYLKFHTEVGAINILAYNKIKLGDMFIMNKNGISRGGAHDVKFGLSKTTAPNGEVIETVALKELENQDLYEVRALSQQFLRIAKPVEHVLITNLLPSVS